MKNPRLFLFHISLFIVLLSFPSSFAHKKSEKDDPNCVCTCTPPGQQASSGEATPSDSSPSGEATPPSPSGEATTPSGSSASPSGGEVTPTASSGSPGKSTPPASSSSPGATTPPTSSGSPSVATPPTSSSSPGESIPPASSGSPSEATPPASSSSPGKATPSMSSGSPGESTPPASSGSPGEASPPTSSGSPGESTPSASSGSPAEATPPTSSGSPGASTPPASSSSPGEASPPTSLGSLGESTPPTSSGSPGESTPPASSGSPGEASPPTSSGSLGESTPLASSGSPAETTPPTSSSSSGESTPPESSGSPGEASPPTSSGSPAEATPPTSSGSPAESTPPKSSGSPSGKETSPSSGQEETGGLGTGSTAPGGDQGSVSGGAKEEVNVELKSSLTGQFKGAFKRIYAFGDSYTDTGNAAMTGGFQSFLNLFKNSPYGSKHSINSGQRMSNGRLIIDFLCDALDIPPLPAFKDSKANFSAGCNFAIAGSTSLSMDFFASHKISHSFMWKQKPESCLTQIDWFSQFLSSFGCNGKDEAACKKELAGTLFWIGELGGNDYTRIFGSPISTKFITAMAVEGVTKFIQALLEKGAKYLVVQGLPPAGCCPLELALRPKDARDPMGCSSAGNEIIMAHNELLQQKLEGLRKKFPGCQIVFADTFNAYKTILTEHKKYNFVEPFKACCGKGGGLFDFDMSCLCGAPGSATCPNPDQYISWDGIHLTEAMHLRLAELLFKKGKGFCKPSFEDLIKARLAAEALD